MNSQTILIADDDNNIALLISLYLKKEGFNTLFAADGMETLDAIETHNPNLLILDIMMPNMDGYEVCRRLKNHPDLPVIILSAKSSAQDKVLGLDLGADDYISKPFDNAELVARVKALLRRYEKLKAHENISEPSGEIYAENKVSTQSSEVLLLGNLTINKRKHEVTWEEKAVQLKPMEFDLLLYLCSHPNTVFSRDDLLKEIWGYDFAGDTRTVDVHITRLRDKIPDNDKFHIATVWKLGYKLEVK